MYVCMSIYLSLSVSLYISIYLSIYLLELKVANLVDTARKLGLNEFLRATDSVDMTEELQHGNFTVFAPLDSAWTGEPGLFPLLPALMPQVRYVRQA